MPPAIYRILSQARSAHSQNPGPSCLGASHGLGLRRTAAGRPLRQAVRAAYRADETEAVARILAAAELRRATRSRIAARRAAWSRRRGSSRHGKGGIDVFLTEYRLSSQEGIALMCLAEALLRIPDAATVDRLIRDKLAPADWARHLGQSPSLFVNASTWALMLTGRLVQDDRRRRIGARCCAASSRARASRWCARR